MARVTDTTVGVVVPAYRPDPDLLAEYLRQLAEQLDPATLRVELDDPTRAVRETLAASPATVAVSARRRGKGGAITDGFDALDTDTLAFTDADGATPVPEFERVVDAVVSGDVALAVGSRRHPDATVETSQSRSRAVLGDCFAWFARRVLDVSLYDYQCGAKAITAGAWRRLREDLTERGFAWDVELLGFAGARDLTVREVPIAWHDHPDSTVPPLRTALDMGTALLRTGLRTNRVDETASADGRATVHASKNE